MRFFRRLANLAFPSTNQTINTLGYPSLEELESVGLTGHEFMERYVRTVKPRAWDSLQDFADRINGRFYADYPQLKKVRS